MTNKAVTWISALAWLVVVIYAYTSQGSDLATNVVLLLSLWLMFLGWRLSLQRGRL